ncbi:type II toxin-antitoxin system RelE/ParE family toxin [Methylobacterium nigriterrae]|uniref:type II toxin-antitoxin system RelE/ParE family toxin n=1 Tax=Methylobacterium nigriterrae TaxID=3127512 RepID=UPI003013F8CC
MRIAEFVDERGVSPFAAWFDRLDPHSAAKVTVALTRIEQGNLSNVKSVGGGVSEIRLDFGPGYRLYVGRDGDCLIILLAGGTKRRQQQDIIKAQARWAQYRQAKKDSRWH